MAHVVIEVSPGSSSAVSDSAPNFMTCRPHHLSVVADFLQVITGMSIGKVSVFKEPRLQCEEPGIVQSDR